jgi:hypothetical protein
MIEDDRTNFRAFAGHSLGGVVGTAVYVTIAGGIGPLLGLVCSLLGGLILGIAEVLSWAVESRWIKGVLFGGAAGVLAGTSSYLLLSGGTLIQQLASYGIGGLVGGMIWKGLTVSPAEASAT